MSDEDDERFLDELGEVDEELWRKIRKLPPGGRVDGIETRVGSDWIRKRWEKADATRAGEPFRWPDGDWSQYAHPQDFATRLRADNQAALEQLEANALTNAAAVEEAALSGADRRRWSPTRWRKHDRGTHPTRLCYPRVRRPKLDRIAWQCVAVYAALGLVFIWTLWLCRPR